MRADFYVLPTSDPIAFACRLLEKTHQEKHTVFVLAQTKETAEQLDKQLWTFKDISFVPHHLANNQTDHSSPIAISTNINDAQTHDVLLLLTPELPEKYTSFERVMMVIPDVPEWKQQARESYKVVKGLGVEINMHKM